ncbi:MAG: hypothetical protein IPL78_14410 [Chloroflexi bacterium]|nr:hypothetical protein [Chloroflexota bacterium]
MEHRQLNCKRMVEKPKRKSMRMVTLVFLFVLIGFLLILNRLRQVKGGVLPHQYLTPEQYSILNEMLEVYQPFLNPMVITSTGLPLTAYKVGDRARFGYSNPTEWGYALQAWIAAAERGIISESEAVNRITLAFSDDASFATKPG